MFLLSTDMIFQLKVNMMGSIRCSSLCNSEKCISDVCIHLPLTVYIQAAWKTGQEGRKGVWKGAGQSQEGNAEVGSYHDQNSSMVCAKWVILSSIYCLDSHFFSCISNDLILCRILIMFGIGLIVIASFLARLCAFLPLKNYPTYKSDSVCFGVMFILAAITERDHFTQLPSFCLNTS